VTKIDLVNNRLIPNAIEPRAAIGDYDSGQDSFTLWTTSQNPHVARLVLAAFIGIAPEHRLRVIAPDVGGGFGSKIFIYAEETVCLWASKKVGRPVKWVAERTESFLADAHGRDHVTTAELAVDAGGKILALRAKTKANLGGYLSTFASSVPTYLYAPLLSGQYDIGAIYCEVDGVYTNTAPVDAYRGAGRPEATFVVERLVEVARARPARTGRVPPPELHQELPARHARHHATMTRDYGACLDKALELADYKGLGARKAASARRRSAGWLLGLHRGLRHCAERGRRLLGAGVGLWEIGRGARQPEGSVEVLTGSHSHGQGTRPRLPSSPRSASASHRASHDRARRHRQGAVRHGHVRSRSGAVGISAIYYAIDKVIVKAKKVAGFVLEVPEPTVDFKDGIFSHGHQQDAHLPEVALQAYIAHKFTGAQLEPGLKEGAFFDPTNFTFPSGVHICEVEVDPETGATKIERWTAVDDFGTLINPMIVEGQVHGGIAQGVGQALLEGAVYDKEGSC
jgi:carbon-monoxide dehydrogenase large subunit